MKELLIFTGIVLLATGCATKEQEKKPENALIPYVIQGEVTNGEGERLALRLQGENLDDRQVVSITNGRFEFCGFTDAPQSAWITFEKEHENEDGAASIYELFLTGDTIQLQAEVVEEFGNLRLANDSILESDINRYHRSASAKFRKAYDKAWVFSDSIKNDSMRRYVYPDIRTQVLQAYEQFYSESEHPLLQLTYLKRITDDNFIFNPVDLSSQEKEQLNDLFQQIDPSLESSPDFPVVSSAISNLNNLGAEKEFMDFSLPDLEGREQQLSKIIQQNEYTVLDFWWSGCRPCRQFNRQNREAYSEIKKKGIEIIAVNVDMGESQWQLASERDSIPWIDLYAGGNSKIEADYNITSFPAKIIVDKNLNIIEMDFRDLEELEEKLLSVTPVKEEEL